MEFLSKALKTFVNIWLHPVNTLNELKAEGEGATLGFSMIFVVIMGLLSGIISTVMGMIFPPIGAPDLPVKMLLTAGLLVPVFAFVGSFLGAGILWGISSGFVKGSSYDYKACYRLLAVTAAFTPVSSLLSSIPKVGVYLAAVVFLWTIYVIIRGVITLLGTQVVRTWIVLVLVFGLMFLLTLLMRVNVQNQMRNQGMPRFEDNFGGTTDMNFGDEELDKQLNEQADKAKAEAAPKK